MRDQKWDVWFETVMGKEGEEEEGEAERHQTGLAEDTEQKICPATVLLLLGTGLD